MPLNRQFRTLIESSPVGVVLIRDERFVYVNQVYLDMTGFDTRDEVIGLSASEHAASESREGFRRECERSLRGEDVPTRYPAVWLKRGGLRFPCEINLGAVELGDGTAILGFLTDLTSYRQAEAAIARRLLYEEAVAACSQVLMAGQPDNLRQVLQHLLAASGASRVYVFENLQHPELGLCTSQICEATAEGVEPQIGNPFLQCYPYSHGATRWVQELGAGQPIYGLVETFPDSEREFLERQGILSILVLPVRVDGRWWGFIGFDDTVTRREWSEEDVRLLRTVAEMIGSFLERTSARAAIEFGRQQMLSIFESITESVYVSDPLTYEMLFANRALRRSLGGRDPVGELCYQVLQRRDAPCDFCSNDTILRQKGTPYRWDHYNAVTGKHYLITDRIIRWPDGRDVRFELAIDVTDRKRAEEALRQSEQRHRRIIETAQEGILIVDGGGRISYANEKAARMLGRGLVDIVGRPATEFVDPACRGRWSECLEGLRCSACGQCDCTFRLEDGTALDAIVATSRLEDADGRVIGALAMLTDITRHKQTEEDLRRTVSLLNATLESTMDGILVVNRHGEALAYNRKLLEMWRIPESLLGSRNRRKLLDSLLSQIRSPEAFSGSVRALMVNCEGAFHHIIECLDGRVFELYTQTQTLGQEMPGRVWSFRDISERKRLESELLQAQRLESVGRLAGGVAHDFNNLLTIIAGHCALLMENAGPDHPMRPGLEEIRKAGERAAGLTRQLLAFSRKQILKPKPLDLNATVRETDTMLRRLIGEDIGLVTTLDPDLGTVVADPIQWQQVLMNLVVNARDAMPQGGRLTIETTNLEVREGDSRATQLPPGRYVMLRAADTGHGMDEQTQGHIFEPFFTTKESGKGTGLGLSTVYGIVKQSGGHIWVESQPNQGAMFNIVLPRVDMPAPAQAEIQSLEPLFGSGRILLVEDELEVRRMAAAVLKSCGYEVLEAENGEAALAAASRVSGGIDLLLTDVVMPGMNGRELAVRLCERHPGLRILYISGYPDARAADPNGQHPVAGYLQKPFTPRSLAAKVCEVLTS